MSLNNLGFVKPRTLNNLDSRTLNKLPLEVYEYHVFPHISGKDFKALTQTNKYLSKLQTDKNINNYRFKLSVELEKLIEKYGSPSYQKMGYMDITAHVIEKRLNSDIYDLYLEWYHEYYEDWIPMFHTDILSNIDRKHLQIMFNDLLDSKTMKKIFSLYNQSDETFNNYLKHHDYKIIDLIKSPYIGWRFKYEHFRKYNNIITLINRYSEINEDFLQYKKLHRWKYMCLNPTLDLNLISLDDIKCLKPWMRWILDKKEESSVNIIYDPEYKILNPECNYDQTFMNKHTYKEFGLEHFLIFMRKLYRNMGRPSTTKGDVQDIMVLDNTIGSMEKPIYNMYDNLTKIAIMQTYRDKCLIHRDKIINNLVRQVFHKQVNTMENGPSFIITNVDLSTIDQILDERLDALNVLLDKSMISYDSVSSEEYIKWCIENNPDSKESRTSNNPDSIVYKGSKPYGYVEQVI